MTNIQAKIPSIEKKTQKLSHKNHTSVHLYKFHFNTVFIVLNQTIRQGKIIRNKKEVKLCILADYMVSHIKIT